jgi:hypothetical protein
LGIQLVRVFSTWTLTMYTQRNCPPSHAPPPLLLLSFGLTMRKYLPQPTLTIIAHRNRMSRMCLLIQVNCHGQISMPALLILILCYYSSNYLRVKGYTHHEDKMHLLLSVNVLFQQFSNYCILFCFSLKDQSLRFGES